MRVKDIREDIFDEQLVKRIYWLYKGDDFIAYINLKYTPDLIDEVVFSMSELFQPINLSLESSQIGSKWKLFIPHYITQSFATKEHAFTISIKLMTGVIITLFKGFINVNNRLFTNGEKPNITMTIIAERNPTEEDYVYQIGTPWFNKESKELFYLTKVQQESATWIDHTSSVLVEYINTELAKKADKDYVDNELFDTFRLATILLKGLMSPEDKSKVDLINDDGDGELFLSDDGTYKEVISGVQSDWNESDTDSLAYIQHKPAIPTISTNISNDSESDIKTTSPKAVYEHVDTKYETLTQADIDNKTDVPRLVTGKMMRKIIDDITAEEEVIILGVLGEPASNSQLSRYVDNSYEIDPQLVTDEHNSNYKYWKWDDTKWPFSEMVEVIEDDNVFIKIPKMYVRKVFDGSGVLVERYISNERLDGFELPEFFIDHDTGQELPFGLVAKYNGTNQGGTLVSKSRTTPQVSTTLATSRTRAMKNGVGYHLLDMHVKFLLETLYLIVFAHSNSDTLFPQGVDGIIQNNGILDNMEHHTGYTKGLNNYLMKFLGIENYFSNIRTQVDGVKIVDREVFVANDYRDYNSDENTDNYLSIGTTSGNGYIKELGDMGIPLTVGDSAGSYYVDYLHSALDYRTLYFGRNLLANSDYGLFYWSGSRPLGFTDSSFGVRLVKKATS